MPDEKSISVEFLWECFTPDFDTGSLTWRKRPDNHFTSARSAKTSNGNNAGLEAGTLNKRGYMRVKIGQRIYPKHRIIYSMFVGRWYDGVLDHLNRKRDDNRICNLVESSPEENSKNLSLSKRNKSGCSGVTFNNQKDKWEVRFRVNGSPKRFGYFINLEDALKVAEKERCTAGYRID